MTYIVKYIISLWLESDIGLVLLMNSWLICTWTTKLQVFDGRPWKDKKKKKCNNLYNWQTILLSYDWLVLLMTCLTLYKYLSCPAYIAWHPLPLGYDPPLHWHPSVEPASSDTRYTWAGIWHEYCIYCMCFPSGSLTYTVIWKNNSDEGWMQSCFSSNVKMLLFLNFYF